MLRVATGAGPVHVPLFNVVVSTVGWFRRYRVNYREVDEGVISTQKTVYIHKIKKDWR